MVILERNGTVTRRTEHRLTLRIVLRRPLQWLHGLRSTHPRRPLAHFRYIGTDRKLADSAPVHCC